MSKEDLNWSVWIKGIFASVIEGLNVEDGCYTWYMSVKDKVADWYNMETGEALCCYKVTRKDELLQDIYLDEDIFPNSG